MTTLRLTETLPPELVEEIDDAMRYVDPTLDQVAIREVLVWIVVRSLFHGAAWARCDDAIRKARS